MKKEWRDIKGYEGRYRVSNHGDVVSIYAYGKKREKPFALKMTDCNGYHLISLANGTGGNARAYVHRLVAEAFLPPERYKTIVNHKDGIRSNNPKPNYHEK